MFSKKSKGPFVGIYLVFDPALPDKATRFSPPYFSPADDIACSALLETLRRHATSCDQLYASPFRRMDLWRVGSVDLASGKVITASHRYKVCNVGSYLDKPAVRHYMQQVPYPSESDVIHNF